MYLLTTFLSFLAIATAVPLVVEQRAPPQKYEGTYTFITSAPWPCYNPDPDAELVTFLVSYKGHSRSTEENGVVTYKAHQTSRGQGVGERSGTKYQLSQVENSDITWTSVDQHVHAVNHFKIVEQGGGQVFYTHANVEFTFDPTIGVVYKIDNTRNSCDYSDLV